MQEQAAELSDCFVSSVTCVLAMCDITHTAGSMYDLYNVSCRGTACLEYVFVIAMCLQVMYI